MGKQNDTNNYELKIGEYAMSIVTKNKDKYIEVVVLKNPTLYCTLAYNNLKYISGNIPSHNIPHIINCVRRNKKYLILCHNNKN